jgi:hypothetical protein
MSNLEDGSWSRNGTRFVPNLESDRFHVFDTLDNFSELNPILLPPACGPRHLAFATSGLMLVVSELESTLNLFNIQFVLISRIQMSNAGGAAGIARFQISGPYVNVVEKIIHA